MNRKLSLLLACLMVGTQVGSASLAEDGGPADPGEKAGAKVSGTGSVSVAVPGTGVTMPIPAGFTAAKRFSGFESAETGASVMVTEMPAPYSKTSLAFSEEGLKSKGMNLLSKEEVKLGDRDAVFAKLTQDAYGKTFTKLLVSFGTEQQTVMVTATYLEGSVDEDNLKQSLLGVTWKEGQKQDPYANITYSVSAVEPFKLAMGLQNSLLFTVNGSFPQQSPDQPMFVVAEGLRPVAPELRETYSKTVMNHTAKLDDMKETSFASVNIDGLKGFESTAVGKDGAGDRQMFVYQTILYTDDGYYRCLGMVSETERAKFEKAFAQMSKSFKRKN